MYRNRRLTTPPQTTTSGGPCVYSKQNETENRQLFGSSFNLKALQQNASVWSFSRITAFDRRCTRRMY
jgi:hypothetical protein